MNGLDGLIRLNKWKLDEKRLALAELERLAARLRDQLSLLEREMAAEQKVAAGSIEAGIAYGQYANAVIARRTTLAKSLGEVDVQIRLALEDVAEAFRDLKKFDIIKVRRDRDGRVDLKLFGLLPLVGAVRLYALAHGVAATGTRPRLAALAELGVLPAAETANLSAAFDLLAGRILRQQIDDSLAGRPLGTFVSVATLPARENERLVEALRAIALLATRARGDFMGRLI